MKLLGVPKISNGTGEAQATAVFELLEEWNITERIQLSLLFLGDETAKDFNICTPGALHPARWMAELIYSLKIYLFRSQFKLIARELSALRIFNIFVLKVYI